MNTHNTRSQSIVAKEPSVDLRILGARAAQGVCALMEVCSDWSNSVWGDFEERFPGRRQEIQSSATVAYLVANPGALGWDNDMKVKQADLTHSPFNSDNIRRWTFAYRAYNQELDSLGFHASMENFKVSDLGAIVALAEAKSECTSIVRAHMIESIFNESALVCEALRVRRIQENLNLLFLNVSHESQNSPGMSQNAKRYSWDNWSSDYIEEYLLDFYLLCTQLNPSTHLLTEFTAEECFEKLKNKKLSGHPLESVCTPGTSAHVAFVSALALEQWVYIKNKSESAAMELSQKSPVELLEKSALLPKNLKEAFLVQYEDKLLSQMVKEGPSSESVSAPKGLRM